jgi:hypothetical protein
VQGHPQLVVKTLGGSQVTHTSIRSTEFSRNPLESKRLDPPIYTACNPRLLLDSRLEPFCSALRSQMNEPEYASTAAVRNGRNNYAPKVSVPDNIRRIK